MERNPELGHALNNPEVLREYMQLASNPNLMQEHLRNADRAMSNLESIPGGFNALRQIYENVQVIGVIYFIVPRIGKCFMCSG